jgi:hypothetical protein
MVLGFETKIFSASEHFTFCLTHYTGKSVNKSVEQKCPFFIFLHSKKDIDINYYLKLVQMEYLLPLHYSVRLLIKKICFSFDIHLSVT